MANIDTEISLPIIYLTFLIVLNNQISKIEIPGYLIQKLFVYLFITCILILKKDQKMME
jgi:hypothetical protein